MYIEFNTGHPDMVDKGEGGAIGVQGGATNGVANVLRNKFLRSFQTKMGQNTVGKTSA